MNGLSIETAREIAPGVHMPLFGLGAFKMPDDQTGKQAVIQALETGYRHIDTASVYGNEETVGRAIRESGTARDGIFITSKCWLNEMGTEETPAALERSLRKLGTDYLDLYLIHWPDDTKLAACWEAMIRLRDSGKVRAIGVCNFTVRRLENFFTYCGEKPCMNQFEMHLFHQRPDVTALCRQHGIHITAYCPLARAKKLNDPTLAAVAEKYGKTPAQIMLRWILEQGIFTVPKSENPDRIRQNADVFDFSIEASDLARLNKLDEARNCSDWLPDPSTWY